MPRSQEGNAQKSGFRFGYPLKPPKTGYPAERHPDLIRLHAQPGRLRLRLACWATHLAGAGEAVHRVGSTLSKGFPCARQAAAELFSPIFPRALGEHGINKYHSRSWTLNFLRKPCWWQTKSLDFFRPVHSGSEWSIVFGLTGPSCPFYMSSGSFQLTLNLPLVSFSATSQKAIPLFSSHMGFALNHRRLDKVFISKVFILSQPQL